MAPSPAPFPFPMPQCVELKPDWAKGYSRLGAAHHGLGSFQDAVQALEKGEGGGGGVEGGGRVVSPEGGGG